MLFVDDAHRTDEELVDGVESCTVERRLRDGTAHRAVKVPYTADVLQRELAQLGWSIDVRATRGPFYWGYGSRAESADGP